MSGFDKLFEKAPPSSVEPAEKNKGGRPATGKRSSVEYSRHTVFLKIETVRKVLRFQFDRKERGDEEGDFSDVVDEALRFWLEHGRPSGK